MADRAEPHSPRPPIAASLVALRRSNGPCAPPELDVRVTEFGAAAVIAASTLADWPGVIVDGRHPDTVDAVAEVQRRLPALRIIAPVDDLQVASQLLRAGVCRIVPAGRWDLLVAAVHHELSDGAWAAPLETTEVQIETVLTSSTDLLVVIDEDSTLRWISPAATEALDGVGAGLRGLLGIIHDDDRDECAEFFRTSGRSSSEPIEYRIRSRAGSWLVVRAVATDHRDDPGVAGIVVSQLDITAERQHHEQLVHQATHDPLTNLPMRVRMTEHLSSALARMRRDSGGVAVCFLDLDGFKAVNDRLGHEAGDAVLVETAKRLTAAVRSTDLVARIGGDEFIVVLDGLTGPDDALAIADKFVERLGEPIQVDAGPARVGASVGIAIASGPDDDPAHLLADADAAMYQVKASGKNGRQLFDDLLRTVADDRVDLERRLRAGIDGGEISARYAPILGLTSGEVVGFTATQWWSHPVSGELVSSVWRVLADEVGFGPELDHGLLEEAALLHARWARAGRSGRTVWLPCSRRQLLDVDFAHDVAATIQEHDLVEGALGLRLRESELAKAPTELAWVMERLRPHGVRFALSDFRGNGVGPDILQDLPIDTLLLDPHFARRLGSDERATRTLAGIIAMSRPLGLELVATGVDNHTHLAFVLQLSCANATGALFAHAQSAEHTTAMLRDDYAWNVRTGATTVAAGGLVPTGSIEGLGSPARRLTAPS